MLPKKKTSLIPTSGDLRVKDPKVLHAEIAFLRQKIVDKIAKDPAKAAYAVTELVNEKPASPAGKIDQASPAGPIKKKVA